ncbi:MAG: asparaginase [Ahrensia sp.]|nr:asparaginase [Ahrensia sp.]
MNNPVLVELTRGGMVESVHRGSVAVVDASGKSLLSLGETEKPVFARSAMKLIQALPLVESGAADAYGFANKELSLACASHSSEAGHTQLAQKMLRAARLDEPDLECGAHWPLFGDRTRLELAQSGALPTALHNNCSGKHTGFLCCAKHSGMKTSGYTRADHALQRDIVGTIENVVSEKLLPDQCGVDGCSAPTFAASLKGFAHGYARLATGVNLQLTRASAAKRLMTACMAEPWYMAGTDRFCTRVMEIGQGRIFAKVGAEGVYIAAIPELGLGIALKADDGAERAAEMMLAGVLQKLLGEDVALGEKISSLTHRDLRNWNGILTGQMRATVL